MAEHLPSITQSVELESETALDSGYGLDVTGTTVAVDGGFALLCPSQSVSSAVTLDSDIMVGMDLKVWQDSDVRLAAGLTTQQPDHVPPTETAEFGSEFSIEILPRLVSLEIQGSATLNERSLSEPYKTIAHYNDDSTQDVTEQALYSFFPSTIYAEVVTEGIVITKSVDEDQALRLKSVYSENGTTVETLLDLTLVNVPPTWLDDPGGMPVQHPEDSPCGLKGEFYKAITDAQVKLQEAIETKRANVEKLALLQLELTSARLEIKTLEAIQDYQIQTYCADHSLELTGSVGTAEINGRKDVILIMPAGASGLGQLQPIRTTTPAAAAFNYAVLPGWQKWKPTYRVGVLSALDKEHNTCTVTLDAATTVQGLNINQASTLTSVPIKYMTCNADAFEDGDRVLVEFQGYSWASPRVIGFADAPSACPQLVKIQFTSVTANSAFSALCDQRIAELQRLKDHADYCKDTFIPAVLAWMQSLVGRCYAMVGTACWGRYAQAMIDQWAAPYIAWRDSTMGANHDLGYQSYVDSVDTAISLWTNAKTYFAGIVAFGKGDYTGGLDSELDTTGASLSSFAAWVDCCKTSPIPDIVSPDSGTVFQRAQQVSAAAKTLYDSLSAACAPECVGKIYVPDFFEWAWSSKGAIDEDGKFYLLSKGYGYRFSGLPGGQIETLSITVSVDSGRFVFEYPSNVTHNVSTWKIGAKNAEIATNLAIGIKGRLPDSPVEFGATVAPLETAPDGSLISWGGIVIDENPYTFMWPWYRDSIEGDEKIPRGFEDFAGRYPDHPIVTGVDWHVVTGGEAGDLEYVNNYVQGTYAYKADEEDYDHWTFLSPTNLIGDCEDFAITKIQMLIDRGWSISKLKLEVGARQVSYDPPQYDGDGAEILKYIGHAWVVVDGATVLDSEITTREAMRALYPHKGRLQVSGLVWRSVDTEAEYTAIPAAYHGFDIEVATIQATIARKEH